MKRYFSSTTKRRKRSSARHDGHDGVERTDAVVHRVQWERGMWTEQLASRPVRRIRSELGVIEWRTNARPDL